MNQHFAIGLVVKIRKGAKPVGWPEDEPFEEEHLYEGVRQITDVAPQERDGSNPLGSFEAGGWYWAPEDITVDH